MRTKVLLGASIALALAILVGLGFLARFGIVSMQARQYHLAAWRCYKRNDWASAVSNYSVVVRLRPRDESAYLWRGWAYNGAGKMG